MQVTITIADEFKEVVDKLGLTPEAYLTALASQEIMRHFREAKEGKQKNLLFG